jgi:hypothetical protein
MEETMIPDSVMRMEAVQAAVATAPEGEVMHDFMARVKIIYGFLTHTSMEQSHDYGSYASQ